MERRIEATMTANRLIIKLFVAGCGVLTLMGLFSGMYEGPVFFLHSLVPLGFMAVGLVVLRDNKDGK